MVLDRLRAEEQRRAHLAVGHALGHELGDAELLPAELLVRGARGHRGRAAGGPRQPQLLAGPRRPRVGAQAVEDVERLLQRLALLEGKPREAVAALQEGERVGERIQWGAPAAAETRGDLGDALAAEGDLDAISALAAGLREGAEPTVRVPLAIAARLEGIAGADEEFEERFAEALEHHDAIAMPYERARTLLALGVRRRRSRRRGAAREPLADALEVFERLGAATWAAQARGELELAGAGAEEHGVAPPAAGGSALEELTPQELRVALLVGRGLSNREVAGALFVSSRPVEAPLRQIDRKLDLRSRTERARLVAGVDGGYDT